MAICAVRMLSVWNPGLVSASRMKLRVSKPAPISRINDTATSAATIDSRRVRGPRLDPAPAFFQHIGEIDTRGVDGGRETENHAGGYRNQDREPHHPAIDPRLSSTDQVLRAELRVEMQRQKGNEYAGSAACERQQQAFGE